MSLLDDASLLVTPNAEKEGKLYSIIPTNGNGDFSVTRATTATRVNAAGLVELVPYNLFTYSEQFNNVAWGKLAGSSVTANQAIAPNGTMTADLITEGASVLVYNTTLYPAGTYTQSYYAKKGTGDIFGMYFGASYTARFNLTTGTVISTTNTTASITNVGNGWYRCIATATPVLEFFGGISYANTTGANIFAWGAQLVQGTSALDYQMTETRLNIPRLDYSLGSCPNILLEPQRTNVLLNTIFSGSGSTPTNWTQPIATGTSALTTSTIGVGAQACNQSATLQRPFLSQSFTLLANTTYSYSIYIESISGGLPNENILLASGLPSGATATYFLNGVSVSPSAAAVVGRLSIVIVVSSTGGSVGFRCGIGSSGAVSGTLLFSRPQLEAGAYATSYIPTTSASVTRNADVITRNNIFTNGLITASGGTWFVDLRNNIPRIRDAFSSIRLIRPIAPFEGILIGTSASNARAVIIKNIANTFTTLYTTTTDTTKIAIKWNGTTADVFVNGTKVVSATSLPFLDLNEFGNGVNMIATINSMALFPTPLTDGEMSMLTSGIYTPALAYAQLGLVSESPACLTSSVNALL